jgi:hypothetical protein
MQIAEARADVFWLAFKSLPKKERQLFFEKLLVDKKFREDMIDIIIIEQRINEPSRPIEEYLANRND